MSQVIGRQGCCTICEETKVEGITILEQFICSSCEKEIVATDVEDHKYAHFVSQLKSLLCGSASE